MSSPNTILGMLGHSDNLNDPGTGWTEPATILGTTITLLIVSAVCVGLRLWTRFFVVRDPGWDDYCVLLFILSGCLGSVALCVSVQYGLGKHFLLIGQSNIDQWLKTFYVSMGSYQLSTTLVKLSLLLQFLRLYEAGRMRRFTQIMIGVVIVWGLIYGTLAWFPCHPLSDYWHWSPERNCWGFGSDNLNHFIASYITQAATNMILDIIVLSIPLPKYLNHQVDRKTRAALAGMFLLGGIVIASSIWRFGDLVAHRATTWPTFDPTWYGSSAICIGNLEVNLAIICASVPVFWPTLTQGFLGSIFVTQEIKITRHQRYSTDIDREGDEVELQRSKSLQPDHKAETMSRDDPFGNKHARDDSSRQSIISRVSRANSDSSQGPDLEAGEKNPPAQTTIHYMDDFIKAQVDPLQPHFAHVTDVQTNHAHNRYERRRVREGGSL